MDLKGNKVVVKETVQACNAALSSEISAVPIENTHETPTSNSNFSSLCKKINKGEVSVQSMSVVTHPKSPLPELETVLNSNTPNSMEEYLQRMEKDTSCSSTDIMTSPSEGFGGHPTLKFYPAKVRTDFDCDRSGTRRTIVDSSFSMLSKISGEPCDSSKTHLQYLQNIHAVQSPAQSRKSLGGDEINQPEEGVGGQTTIDLETGRHSKQIVSEGVSPDSQLTSSGMAVISREESVNGNIFEDPFYMDSCSRSLEEKKNTGDQCYMVVEDGEDAISMQAFLIDHNKATLSQKPRPEFLREGQVLSLMLSFADLVEKTKEAQLNEPKTDLENKLESLKYFKALGFNVRPIQTRPEELLRVKNRHLQLDGKLKQVEREMIEEQSKEKSLTSEVDGLDEKLGELRESMSKISQELEIVVMEKQTKGSSFGLLQNRLKDMEKEVERAKLDITCITEAP
ncbi:hypothetical protein IFM89_017435 [Coptis chinensis]|uniref:Uncharacterized protein n=1 Tax=Coptis chinensis TaxID=261450 RepID=A0A835H403_9MAGN|nr:hypothetical protein IFM89_017435 [Coptis chinensis]